MMGGAGAEEMLCRLLRNPSTEPPRSRVDEGSAELLLAAARRHGVHRLLFQRIRQDAEQPDWPASWRREAARELRNAAALEILFGEELKRVLEALADAGIEPLLMKGAALGRTHYPEPALRVAADTDLLIPPGADPRTRATLRSLGYELPLVAEGKLVTRQFSAYRRCEAGVLCVLDVHRRVSNRQLFAQALGYPELAGRAVALHDLGPHARALGTVDALLLACMHRIAHINAGEGERLLWLYDIHLLASGLRAGDRDLFLQLTSAKGMGAICSDGLRHARLRFATPGAGPLITALAANASREAASRLLTTGPAHSEWLDFTALAGWRHKLRYLAELAFPSPRYMTERRYPGAPRGLLPLLYLRRAASGVGRRMCSKRSRRPLEQRVGPTKALLAPRASGAEGTPGQDSRAASGQAHRLPERCRA